MEEEKWPDPNAMEQVFDMFKRSEEPGLIQYLYAPEARDISPEAMAKATMVILEAQIAVAVDVFNGVLFVHSVLLDGAEKMGGGEELRKRFRTIFYALRKAGVNAKVIKIKKSGDIQFIE